jgi:hypothetical protein
MLFRFLSELLSAVLLMAYVFGWPEGNHSMATGSWQVAGIEGQDFAFGDPAPGNQVS